MKRTKRRLLSLMLSLVLMLTPLGSMMVHAAGIADWEKETSTVTELVGNTYVIALSSTGTKNRVATGRGSAELDGEDVAVSHNPVCNGGKILDYEACDDITDENFINYQWTVESDGNGGYYLRASGIEDESAAYLNLANGSVGLGAKQSLSITANVDGRTGTYQVANGSNKLRFTNSYSYNSVTYDGFTAADKAASSYLEFYTYKSADQPGTDEPGSDNTITYTRISSLDELSGTFVMGMDGIGPTTGEGANQDDLKVAAKVTNPSGFSQNLDYAIFNGLTNEANEGLLWDIEPYENGYAIKVSGGDDNSYLRIDGAALTFGEIQALTVTLNGSYFNISNGSYYFRFTNSFNSTSCFTAGTSSSSRSVVFYKVTETSDVEILPPEGEPIFTLAAISDLHTDAGIEGWEEPIRGSVKLTTKAIYENEDADVILLGGDLTSAHMGSSWGSTDNEKIANFKAAQNAIIEAAESATDSHRVLYATGNHDFATGLKAFNSGDYIDAQEKYLPKLVDAKNVYDIEANAYFQRSMPSGTSEGIRHVLAYHYNIDGMDFMVLNTPYIGADKHNDYNYDEGSLNWVANKLEAIGKDRTVFFIAHYPLSTDKNVTSGKGVNNATQAILKEKVLDEYPNAIYLYGHDHGGYKIVADTYERVTTYDINGNSYDNRYVMPTGFVSSFVGSMSYYGTGIVPSSLGSETPNVIQGLMVYVYEDRIVFQMKNYGEADMGSYILKEYTLLRDMDLEADNTITSVMLEDEVYVKEGATIDLDAQVLPYTAENRGIIWSSADESIATVDKNGVVTAKAFGDVKIKASAMGNTDIYAECLVHVYSSTIIADFDFDSTASDGAAFEGGIARATGSYTLVDNRDGKALSLNGNNQFLTVTAKDGSSLLSGLNEISVSFEFNPRTSATNWAFFAAPNADQQQYPYEHYIGIFDNEGNIGAERFNNNGSRPSSPSYFTGYGNWYHVTVVLNEAETILYVNGEEVARESSAYAISDILGENSVLYIGKSTWLASGEFATGLIDNYKIYGYALSEEEVIAEAAKYVDKSELEAAVLDAIPETEGMKYTPDTWEVYAKALAEAKAVLDANNALQEEVDAAVRLLNTAKGKLEKFVLPYVDVEEGEWYYEAAYYNYYKGIITGVDETHFQPGGNLLRSQFASILYRMENKPEVTSASKFTDVAADQWYTDAVIWANENGIIAGYENTGLFGPADNITREQMAVMMYRYAGYLKLDTDKKADISIYEDSSNVSSYALEAMQWAVGNGIITGRSNGTKLDPQGSASRAECALIIQRFMK